MLRSSRSRRVIAGGLLALATGALPALAEEPVETALKAMVANIDASPSWKATYRGVVYDAATHTATLSGLAISAENTPVTVDVDTIKVVDYGAGDIGGFNAKALTANGVTINAGFLKVAIDDAELSDLVIPTMTGVAYDPQRPFTSMMRVYANILNARLGHGKIGSLVLLEQLGGVSSRISYEDFELSGFDSGKIASVSVGPLKLEAPSPEGLVTMSVGKVSSTGIDLNAFLRVYNPDSYVNGVGDMVWHQSLANGTYSDVEMSVPGAKIKLAKMSIDDVKLRQPKESFADALDMTMRSMGNPNETPDLDTRMAATRQVMQMLSAFSLGRFSIEGMDIDATGVDQLSVDGFHVSDFSSEGLGEIGVDGVAAAVEGQGAVKIGHIALGGIVFPSFEQFFAHLGRSGEDDDAGGGLANGMMGLLPTLAYAEASDIAVGLPGAPPFKLQRSRIDLKNYLGPIPLDVAGEVTGLEVPSVMLGDGRAGLKRLGYDKIVANYRIKYKWDEASQILALDDLGFGIDGMGSISASAKIGGLSRQTLMNIADPASVANLSLMDAKVRFDDDSIVAKGLGFVAEQMKVPADKFRKQFADALPFLLAISPIKNPTVMAIIKQSGLLAKLAPAIKTFVAAPGSLILSIAPPAPVSVGAIIAAAQETPEKLPDLLNLKIDAIAGTPIPDAPEAPAPAPAPVPADNQTDPALRPTQPAN